MIKIFKKFIAMLILCVPVLAFAYEPYIFSIPIDPNSNINQNWNIYYKHPNPDVVPKTINGMIAYHAFDEAQLYLTLPALEFLTQIIKQHSEKVSSWMQQIKFTNKLEKEYIYKVLWHANTPETSRYLYYKLKTHNDGIVKNIIANKPLDILDREITNSDDLDRLWGAYFATGDSKFLKKIIIFVNENNQLLLFSGYEIVNRQFICEVIQNTGGTIEGQSVKNKNELIHMRSSARYNDIFDSIKKHYQKNKNKMMIRALAIASAIWSLDVNSRQDKEIYNKIKEIVSSDKKLDYWAKIKKILNK